MLTVINICLFPREFLLSVTYDYFPDITQLYHGYNILTVFKYNNNKVTKVVIKWSS